MKPNPRITRWQGGVSIISISMDSPSSIQWKNMGRRIYRANAPYIGRREEDGKRRV